MQEQTGLVQCELIAGDDFIKPKRQKKQKEREGGLIFIL